MSIFLYLSMAEAILIAFILRKITKLENEIEYKDGEIKLLKHNYNTISVKYYEIVNSEEYKKIIK